jgi:hypothetical protein
VSLARHVHRDLAAWRVLEVIAAPQVLWDHEALLDKMAETAHKVPWEAKASWVRVATLASQVKSVQRAPKDRLV